MFSYLPHWLLYSRTLRLVSCDIEQGASAIQLGFFFFYHYYYFYLSCIAEQLQVQTAIS